MGDRWWTTREATQVEARLAVRILFGPQRPVKIRAAGGVGLILEGIDYEEPEVGDTMLRKPAFWKDVRQVYFHAKNSNTQGLVAAYKDFGLLAPKYTDHLAGIHDAERAIWLLDEDDGDEALNDLQTQIYDKNGWGVVPWDVEEVVLARTEDVRRALSDWVSATTLLECIKLKKFGALEERMGWQGAPSHQQVHMRSFDPMEDGEWFQTPGDGSWLQFCSEHSHINPADDLIDAEVAFCGRLPKTQDEQLLGAWERLNDETRIIWNTLGALLEVSSGVPAIVCSGALDAAVAQWLLHEFTVPTNRTCAAYGCSNPVEGSRILYCSTTCYERKKKDAFRTKRRRTGGR